MTAKEKAQELVNKHKTLLQTNNKTSYILYKDELEFSKKNALIEVEKLILQTPINYVSYSTLELWKKVKDEIEKL